MSAARRQQQRHQQQQAAAAGTVSAAASAEDDYEGAAPAGVELLSTDKMGHSLVAARAFKRGEVIFKDKRLLVTVPVCSLPKKVQLEYHEAYRRVATPVAFVVAFNAAPRVLQRKIKRVLYAPTAAELGEESEMLKRAIDTARFCLKHDLCDNIEVRIQTLLCSHVHST